VSNSHNSSSSHTSDVSVARIRAATAKLRALGVENADAVIRLGAAAMVERCVAKYEQRRGEVTVGWLVAAVRKGDAYPDVQPTPRRKSPSELLRAIDEAEVSREGLIAS
jgi:hypothetical protein